ncbi:hypothetical protein CLF_108869 [Clonorchis sinensis]|uniref:Uncharacterized protein n=1 Tax=Clonorchis sinensis TaxID=79923 RepID=G7YIN8_CLOSI|nr:hypothetical protein CLF_108869 [Clonorchis sinensis]
MRRTLKCLLNSCFQISSDGNPVHLEYAEIFLILEEEEKAQVFLDELNKFIPSSCMRSAPTKCNVIIIMFISKCPVWLPLPSVPYDSMLKALQDRSTRPLSASALPSHFLFLKHLTCPSIPRDLNPAVSAQLPHTVPSSDYVDYIITNDCPTQPVTLCPWSSAACTATQTLSPYPSRNISVVLINTRSLLPKLHYIQAISTIAYPTFICITEMWLSPSTPDALISLPGYTIFRSDRSHRRGDGCLIYSRTEMEVSTIDDPLLADTPDSVWLSACRANPPFILGCLYIPLHTPLARLIVYPRSFLTLKLYLA